MSGTEQESETNVAENEEGALAATAEDTAPEKEVDENEGNEET